MKMIKNLYIRGFPGGLVVKNPPANVGSLLDDSNKRLGGYDVDWLA